MVFLDETGDHSLDPVDKDFPVFVLVFLLCEQTEYTNAIMPAFARLKVEHCGHDGVILHSRDIRKALGEFAFLQVPERRLRFYAELNSLVTQARFELIAIAIQKQILKDRSTAARNPYELALEHGMKRLHAYMEEIGQRQVVLLAEARGKNEDDALRLAFLQLLKDGAQDYSFNTIDFDLRFISKRANVLGHQLADLCAYPIARHVIDRAKSHRAFDIVRTKFLNRPGWRHGFKVFP
jgi:hypothetical protein